MVYYRVREGFSYADGGTNWITRTLFSGELLTPAEMRRDNLSYHDPRFELVDIPKDKVYMMSGVRYAFKH